MCAYLFKYSLEAYRLELVSIYVYLPKKYIWAHIYKAVCAFILRVYAYTFLHKKVCVHTILLGSMSIYL
jgi:hypothetical protein